MRPHAIPTFALFAAAWFAALSCEPNEINECDETADCATGLVCTTRIAQNFEEPCPGSCDAAIDRGGECFYGDDTPDRCETFSTPCAEDLVCELFGDDGGTVGTCVPATGRSEGETCTEDDQCSEGLSCALQPQSGAFGGRCARAPVG